MEGLEINSLTGIATFLVLILRFVQPLDHITGDIEDMLRGTYEVVDGGTLAVDQGASHERLPFSFRGLLKNFVSSVVDADADSPQRMQCLKYMAELTQVSGSRRLSKKSLRYARFQHQNVLSSIFKRSSIGSNRENELYNTVSVGAAMIGLAAAANGADILVECVIENGSRVLINEQSTSAQHSSRQYLIIRLWLKQPPTTVISNLSIRGQDVNEVDDEAAGPRLPIYGGDLELSAHVASELNCSLRSEEVLGLWQEGLLTGQCAKWRGRRENPRVGNEVTYVDNFFDAEVPFDLARLADGLFDSSRGGGRRRSLLARKAAGLIHKYYHASDYHAFDTVSFGKTARLIMVAILVGSIKSLISNGRSLGAYAWTAEVEDLLTFLSNLADTSREITPSKILWQAGRIWGGLTPEFQKSFASANLTEVTLLPESVVGIVCPRVIFMSNVLLSPTTMADRGLDGGLLSWYEGSCPMLPREQATGFILSASAPYTRPPVCLDLSLPAPLSKLQFHDTRADGEFDRLIFSVEPAITNEGITGVVLCVWHLGDLVMILNPSEILKRLVGPLKVQSHKFTTPSDDIITVAHLKGKDVLEYLECGFEVRKGVCIIDTGSDPGWLVVAAGVCVNSHVTCLRSLEDVHAALDPQTKFSGENEMMFVLLKPQSELSSYQNRIERRDRTIRLLQD
ncbi:MAG: hypothetical protein M1822_008656 [Bathelium mastoideum]|nr:MAG: hypothetical protein M1822_008656 [Bathelium mastoideum]